MSLDINIIYEKHLIMKCPYYLNLRNEMFGQLNLISDFTSLNSNAKFNIIMTENNGDADFCKPIAEFINKCLLKEIILKCAHSLQKQKHHNIHVISNTGQSLKYSLTNIYSNNIED